MVEQSCLRFEADVDRRSRRRSPWEEEEEEEEESSLRGINRNIKEFGRYLSSCCSPLFFFFNYWVKS